MAALPTMNSKARIATTSIFPPTVTGWLPRASSAVGDVVEPPGDHVEIADERWKRAMKAIGEACQVASSKEYLRLYVRVGDTDEYRPISLDLAAIALPAERPLQPAPGVH